MHAPIGILKIFRCNYSVGMESSQSGFTIILMQFKFTIFVLLLVSVVSSHNFTCYDSTSIQRSGSQCTLVTWNVARLVDPKYEASSYEPYVQPISKQEELVSVFVLTFYFIFRSYMQSTPVVSLYLVLVRMIC